MLSWGKDFRKKARPSPCREFWRQLSVRTWHSTSCPQNKTSFENSISTVVWKHGAIDLSRGSWNPNATCFFKGVGRDGEQGFLQRLSKNPSGGSQAWSQTRALKHHWVVRSTNSRPPPPAGWLNPNLWGGVPRVFAQALLFLMIPTLGITVKIVYFDPKQKHLWDKWERSLLKNDV